MEKRDVTELLIELRGGSTRAMDDLMPLIYDELRRMARLQMARERESHTMGTTGLVHEAFLKLVDQRRAQWQNRAHFFAVASQAMRRILVDHAKRQRAKKRGEGITPAAIDDLEIADESRSEDLIALDEALDRLAALSPRQSRIVEHRFFGGLSIEESAEVLGISSATVKRDWQLAKAWLFREMQRMSAGE